MAVAPVNDDRTQLSDHTSCIRLPVYRYANDGAEQRTPRCPAVISERRRYGAEWGSGRTQQINTVI